MAKTTKTVGERSRQSRWNTKPGIDDNNCYNYANDVFSEIDGALPGGVLRTSWTEHEMHRLLVADGLIPAGRSRKTRPRRLTRSKGHLIAVFLRTPESAKIEDGEAVTVYRDFHCLRADADGTWSHKDGKGKVKRTDDRNRLLADLESATFRLGNALVGYYWSIPRRRRIRPCEMHEIMPSEVTIPTRRR